MDVYRKERSSRQHMKVNSQDSEEHDGGLLLANPMASMDISPSSAPSIGHGTNASNHSGSMNTSVISGHGAHSAVNSSGSSGPPLSRATNERSSFKSKSRPKSPSLFRFFVRGHSGGGGGRKASCDVDEEDYGADASGSGSEHEDPFSPRGITTTGDFITNRHTTDVPKSPNGSLQRQYKRQHSSSTGHAQRDSGFSSERESISHSKEEKDRDSHFYHNMDDLSGDDYHPAGMDALEVLQNQIQLLVKQDCDDVDTDSVNTFEQVIAGLSRQVEDLSSSLDSLRQSDHNLRLSLRLAEQRALEAEIKLGLAIDRSQRAEQKCLKLAFKYRGLSKKYRELEKFQQKQAVLHQMELATPSPKLSPLQQQRIVQGRSPPQRVQSQTQYDRNNPSENSALKRPSTVQGFHSGDPSMSITSLSHTETRV